MRKGTLIVTAMLLAAPGLGHANNAKCWGLGQDDKSRPDITCTQLTPTLLHSLRGATRAEVLKAMDEPGRAMGPNELRFVSNYARGERLGSGAVNFVFGDKGRVTNINAEVDVPDVGGQYDWIWNGALGSECSDFPGSQNRCADE